MMKRSLQQISEKNASNLDSLFRNIHAVAKISFLLLDKDFHLISALSEWETYISNFFFMNCPFPPKDIAASTTSVPFYFSDTLHLNWFVFPLAFSKTSLVFGPVFETEVNPVFFSKKTGFSKYVGAFTDSFFKDAERYSGCS